MSVSISLVTLTRDNPIELAKTVKSVSLQTRTPDTYLVVDSSSAEFAPVAKTLAESVGATYVWTKPEGIYAAMRLSLELIPRESFSWWINSSDWLAGRQSVNLVHESLSRAENRPSWLVGKLIRLKDGRYSLHRSGRDGAAFVKHMKVGRTGFPHPSTIFWTPQLQQIRPYEDGFVIASDYSTALGFADRFGPPLMVSSPLAVHVPDGLSVRRPVRNVLEKSAARLKHNSGLLRWVEPALLSANAIRGALAYLSAQPAGSRVLSGQIEILGNNSHFCLSGNDSSWPECCDHALADPGMTV